jgi:hypothetical protein
VHLINLSLKIQISISLGVNVNNLFDTTYIQDGVTNIKATDKIKDAKDPDNGKLTWKQEELTKVLLTETEYSSDSEELGLQPYHSTSNYHNIRYSQYQSRL